MSQSWTRPFSGIVENGVDAGIDVWPNKGDTTDAGFSCPQYKYCPKGTKNPLTIPRGTMQHLYARGSMFEVIQMPAGSYSKETTPGAVPYLGVTTECEVGHYCPPGSFEMIACPTGYFRDNVLGNDADSCGLCPAGTFCPTEGMSVPTICSKGHFCPEGSANAQPCPRGTYNDIEGLYDSRGCKACSAGYFCPFMGQIAVDTVNHECDAGYYCIEGSSRPEPTDETTGSRCPPGGYCLKGGSKPESCAAG